MAALAWLAGQAAFAPRVDQLFDLIASAIRTSPSGSYASDAIY
jgi:hypothetical protein